MSQAMVAHLDADCFYVSAERVRYEHLNGLPVGVLGNQGACVIAKSYEMKAAGVSTGVPIWEAMAKCPDGVYVKRDFRWYEVLSRLMLEVVSEFSPKVEYYSIDEFFFEATPPPGMDHQRYAEVVRDRIKERVQIPVTVGIARSRTLAKLISDTAKPFGARAVLDPQEETELLARLPVAEIAGIAGRRERQLQLWGIHTCLDLAQADRRLIRDLLTATGESLWWELNGDPVVPIHPARPLHRALSRGGSFGEATDDPMMIYAWLIRNMERLIEELRYHKVLTKHVSLRVGYRDGQAGEGRASLEFPSDRFDVLLDVLRPCLRHAWIKRVPANRMHLIADHLTPRANAQLGLFESGGQRADTIADLKHEVNKKIGRFTLRSAATLPLASIYQDESNEWDICDVRGKICF